MFFRLAEGHAKLMYKKKIELMDAIFAVKLIGTGSSSEVDPGCSFPDDPMAAYRSEGEIILRTIGLEQLENLL